MAPLRRDGDCRLEACTPTKKCETLPERGRWSMLNTQYSMFEDENETNKFYFRTGPRAPSSAVRPQAPEPTAS
jgi:hypothetical protein